MDKEKNNPTWMSVPQFGDWDQRGGVTDYSVDFSKIREMRKQSKREVSLASLGSESEFASSTMSVKNEKQMEKQTERQMEKQREKQMDNIDDNINPFHKETSSTKKKKKSFWRCFMCCRQT